MRVKCYVHNMLEGRVTVLVEVVVEGGRHRGAGLGAVCRWAGVSVERAGGGVRVVIGRPVARLAVTAGLQAVMLRLDGTAVPGGRVGSRSIVVEGAGLYVDDTRAYPVVVRLVAPRRGLLPAFGVEVFVEGGGVSVTVEAESPEALRRLERVVEGLRLLAAVA